MLSRVLRCVASASAILLGGAQAILAAEVVLPEGIAPAPIVDAYFPSRMHEFVWRNWNLVEPAKMARVVGASAEEIVAVAESMGLPLATAIPAEMKTRGYITILRRNWHLLPYEQLLELVEMTPKQLAFSLQEDDFLYYKLGGVKPKCLPLHYTTPDDAAKRRAAEIKQIVQKELGDGFLRQGEPRFQFLERLSKASGNASGNAAKAQTAASEDTPVRFIYSYAAVYGDPLSDPKCDPYPDGLLEKTFGDGHQWRVDACGSSRVGARRQGFSGIWRGL